jgi:hypothetical protein
MAAGYTMGMEPSGRELLVVVIKGTFRIPTQPGARLVLDEQQVPMVLSDVFFGEPGLSAPKYEVDFAPLKPQCDVLLNGSAYAPGGRPTERVTVGLRIGGWSKSFSVVGDRVWFTDGGVRSTPPVPFVVMPISYDRAFGGTDTHHEDTAQHAAFMPNPSGRGFHKHLTEAWLEGSPLPNSEELGVRIEQPDGNYQPMSFGAIGRHWEQRLRYAGTYDQNWLDNEFPFLPADFDSRYYQAAPAGQQLPKLAGEQPVTLVGLTPEGRHDFVLPHFEAPVSVFGRAGSRRDLFARVDTIVIEPDFGRVMMSWRIATPLKKSIHEVAQVLVGRKGPEWWQEREDVSFPVTIVVEAMKSLAREPDSQPGPDSQPETDPPPQADPLPGPHPTRGPGLQ